MSEASSFVRRLIGKMLNEPGDSVEAFSVAKGFKLWGAQYPAGDYRAKVWTNASGRRQAKVDRVR